MPVRNSASHRRGTLLRSSASSSSAVGRASHRGQRQQGFGIWRVDRAKPGERLRGRQRMSDRHSDSFHRRSSAKFSRPHLRLRRSPRNPRRVAVENGKIERSYRNRLTIFDAHLMDMIATQAFEGGFDGMRLHRNARVFTPRTTKSLACLLQTNNPAARNFALGQTEICCASHRRDDESVSL